MADTIERADFSSLNFGILETSSLGNIEDAEAFLSGEEPLKEIEKEEEKPEDKKPEEKKIDPLAEMEEKEEGQEEEEEKEEEKKEDEKSPEIEFSALAKDLVRLGIFSEMEDEPEITSPEDFLARFQHEKQLGATQWLEGFLSKFGDDRREMFQSIFIDGVDPKEYLPVFNDIQNFESLSIESEENQKLVFREYYKRLGWDSERIEKKLQKTIDYGDLEDETTLLHEQLISQEKKKLEKISEEKRQQEENNRRLDAEYKSNIQRILTEAVNKRDFKGIPITEKKANEVFDFLYTPKYKTSDGKVLTEFDKFILESKKAENLDQRVILALLKTENFDFSKIEKKAISKESNSLFSELAQKAVKTKTRQLPKEDTKSSSWSKL